MPHPEAVNLFCFQLMSWVRDALRHGRHCVVHCTHGYNRTGVLQAGVVSWVAHTG